MPNVVELNGTKKDGKEVDASICYRMSTKAAKAEEEDWVEWVEKQGLTSLTWEATRLERK